MRRRSPTPPEKALLLIGTLFSDDASFVKAQQVLEETFGEIIMESPVIPWNFSEHYKQELGEPIYRKFLFFKNLIDQDQLASIKLKTFEIENNLSIDGKRTINIDPGYLTLAKLVLATTKDYSHRLYLGQGVYAEVTLIYNKEGRFVPLPNTYRDFQDERYQKTFLMARMLLYALLGR
ncbi:MAG: DUF4416 family protein [Nitrospirota bacterium]